MNIYRQNKCLKFLILVLVFLNKLRNDKNRGGAYLPYFKCGKNVLYRLSDLNAWFEKA
ncbi:hypothetical protein [Campylobacter devanensis]|uniref:hypothetical protein n=1 Tax=Campylobacter devanensis TaxID=3161138 RepID=UPI0015D8630B|nr:hypothetical protein [Campylobacter sp. P0106]